MLNSHTRRIQNASSRFIDLVFRISTVWKMGNERSVLRTGREFQTIDAIVNEHFKHIENPPQFPQYLLDEQNQGSQEMLGYLADVGPFSLAIDFSHSRLPHIHL